MARSAGFALRAARFAAIAWMLTPLALLGGALAVPDAPAGLFWAAALAAVLRAARAGEARRGGAALAWWMAAGLAAGLACLSKYSALFLGPGVLLWLLWDHRARALLRTPGPWLALVLAAALFSLNVAWNAGHHWESFARQFGRVTPRAFTPLGPLVFAAGQALLFNPALAALAAIGARRGGEAARPFIATTAPFALYLMFHGLHASVEAHWPAPLYAGLACLAAAGAASLSEAAARRWRPRRGRDRRLGARRRPGHSPGSAACRHPPRRAAARLAELRRRHRGAPPGRRRRVGGHPELRPRRRTAGRTGDPRPRPAAQ